MIFDASSIGTATNKINFNDFNHSPIFQMSQRFPTQREIRQFDLPLPENSGVADYQSFIGKEFYVLDGVMYPDTDNDWQIGRDMLSAIASLEYTQADPLSDNGYVPYTAIDGAGINRVTMMKVLYVDKPENIRQGEAQPFKIFCKVKSPVSIGPVQSTVLSFTSVTAGTTSGLPFGLPVLLGGSTVQQTGSLVNGGSVGAYPTFTIIGPITNPRINNQTTGQFFEVDVNLPTLTDTLVVTYKADSMTILFNGNNVYGSLLAGSTIFKLAPGTNTLSFTGSAPQVGAQCTINYSSTWAIG